MHGPKFPFVARGTFSVGAVVAQVSNFGLFNNSPAQHYIRVWDFTIVAGTNPTNLQVVVGTQGTAQPGAIQRWISGDGAPVGQIQSLQSATNAVVTPSWAVPATAFAGPWWIHEYPFLALLPNTTLWFAPNAVNTALNISIFWDWVTVGELYQDWGTGVIPAPAQPGTPAT